MPRADLLSLTTDDLVILSNRGLVRRAQQELQSGEVTFELREDDTGTVAVRWSDGAECVLPAQRVIGDGRCNCAAVTICRHLIRSVLAYQQMAASGQEQAAEAEQQVIALLQDAEGSQAALIHPYTERGREGAEALLSRLSGHSRALRFVAGRVRLRAAGLAIAPIALVFQEETTRTVLQPWVDRSERTGNGAALPVSHRSDTPMDPMARYPGQVTEALGEMLLLGLDRADERVGRYWQELYRYGAALGFVRFLDPMKRLIDALEQKSHTTRWDWHAAARWTIAMAAFAHLAQEEAPG
jgi:hypothetical protein